MTRCYFVCDCVCHHVCVWAAVVLLLCRWMAAARAITEPELALWLILASWLPVTVAEDLMRVC